MKPYLTIKTVNLLLLLFTFISCSKEDNGNEPALDYSANLVGLWEFENNTLGDALYLGADGEAFIAYYGDLEAIHLVLNDQNTYSYEDNQISYELFGTEPVPYDGSNTLSIPGNTLNKVDGINKLSDFIPSLDINKAFSVDISSFISHDYYNNLDGFGDELFIPNPASDQNRYLVFNKNTLTFIEAVTEVGDNARSIGIIDDLLPMRSILENKRFRIYQPTNPAYHPALSDIPVVDNSIHVHAVTNSSGWDFISYNQKAETFRYHDMSETNKVNGVEDFAFFSLPGSLQIHGMDYVEGENKLIFSDSFNLHIYNIGFSGGSGVSVFEHIASYTVVPAYLGDKIKGRIQGVYYDKTEEWLYLVIGDGYLVRMDFELPK